MSQPFSPSAITSPEGLCVIRMVLLVLKEVFYGVEQSNPRVDKKVPLIGFLPIFIFVDEIPAYAGMTHPERSSVTPAEAGVSSREKY